MGEAVKPNFKSGKLCERELADERESRIHD